MLTQELNEFLTRTGPGTPMGELFRRYWLPALLAEELPEPDCPPVRVKLLGERLIAFYTDPSLAPHELWERLCLTELPRLWLPKREDLRIIDAIPTLGTGKVDLRAIRQLAMGQV